MVRSLSIGLCAWLISTSHLHGQSIIGSPVFTSHSGQFVVQSSRKVKTPAAAKTMRVAVGDAWAFLLVPGVSPQSAETAQEVDPTLLPTSCERLKSSILSELSLPDTWRGRINLSIDPALPKDAEPLLTVVRTSQGWRYELELPSAIKPRHLSRTLVHVILLEMANRNAKTDSTHVPLWLVEGIMAQVQAGTAPALALQPNLRTIGNNVAIEPLESVRKQLRSRLPLTFQDLSWPNEEQLAGKEEEFYQACSQLFVHELMRFKDGRYCLCQFLEQLPQNLNWQVAFLKAFAPHFSQLRDVEKWWGLACLSITGHNLAAQWTAIESGQKIQEALDIPVNVHLTAERLPSSALVSLQEVILQWAPSAQIPTLQRASAALQSLRFRIAPELAPLLNQYCVTLDTFLHTHSPRLLTWIKPDNTTQRFREATCKRLSTLDQQLTAMRARIALEQKEPTPSSPLQMSARPSEATK